MNYLEYINQNTERFIRARKATAPCNAVLRGLREAGLLESAQRVLSISARDGELELALLENPEIRLGYMEESFRLNLVFKNELFRRGKTLQITDSHQGDFLGYGYLDHYDLVLCNHAWQGHGKKKPILNRALGALAENGRLAVILPSCESPEIEIAKMSSFPEASFSAEDFVSWVRDLGHLPEIRNLEHRVEESAFWNADGKLTVLGEECVGLWLGAGETTPAPGALEKANSALRKALGGGWISFPSRIVIIAKQG